MMFDKKKLINMIQLKCTVYSILVFLKKKLSVL